MEHGTNPTALNPLDQFAIDLQQLREQHGVSYAELAHRVSQLRAERGLHEAAARMPRSTVYTCFRTGRARIDTDLLRDIVRAMTHSDDQAELWVARYVDVRRQSVIHRTPQLTSTTMDADSRRPAAQESTSPIAATRLSWVAVMLVVLGAVVLNQLGLGTNMHFGFSLFLDMIGTCVAAIVLGPWYGVAVAVLYHGMAYVTTYEAGGAVFVIVNIAGALVWGYGVRRFRMGDSFFRFTLLGVATAIVCSALGIPLNMLLTFGGTWTGLDTSVLAVEAAGASFEAAVFSVNLTASLLDKFLTGFIALVLFVLLQRHCRVSAAHMPLVKHLGSLNIAGHAGVSHGTALAG